MNATEFTPIMGLLGGGLIGLAAVVLMATNGRILGASGIFAGILTFDFDSEFVWKLLFIIGMMLATAWLGLYTGIAHDLTFQGGPLVTALGGLIVGVGVYLGNGCTSGHGICGNARFSKRSIVATCTFMIVAFATVYVLRHVIGV